MEARSGRPSFVFIMADDMGYADLGCYGARAPMTPRLDQMAGEGLRFTDGYSNSPVCSPTRFALITGRYQYRLRGAAEEPIAGAARDRPELGLPIGHPTLPSLLGDAGYATALAGKWHLGYPPHFGPLKSGYEEFFGPLGGGIDYFTPLRSARRARPVRGRQGGPSHRLRDRPHHRPRRRVSSRAASGDAPFLLMRPLHGAALALGDARRRSGVAVASARRSTTSTVDRSRSTGR